MVTIRQALSFSLRKKIPQKITLFFPQKQIHSLLPQKNASMQTRHGFPSEKPCFSLSIHVFFCRQVLHGLVNLDQSMPPRSRSHSILLAPLHPKHPSIPPHSMPHSMQKSMHHSMSMTTNTPTHQPTHQHTNTPITLTHQHTNTPTHQHHVHSCLHMSAMAVLWLVKRGILPIMPMHTYRRCPYTIDIHIDMPGHKHRHRHEMIIDRSWTWSGLVVDRAFFTHTNPRTSLPLLSPSRPSPSSCSPPTSL